VLNSMRHVIVLGCIIGVFAHAPSAQAVDRADIVVNGSSAGPTPFISWVDLTVTPASAFEEIRFLVQPKPLSVTRPVSASYSAAYLLSRGYFDLQTGHVSLPVFGLYADYSNTVRLRSAFTQGRALLDTVTISTPAFNDPTGAYLNPTVVQPRSTSSSLSYDFIMLKGWVSGFSPVIVDTDAEVRWIGTDVESTPAIFYRNSILISEGTAVTRMELDGTVSSVGDYSGIGVTFTGHHNYDPGKNGILVEVDTTQGPEATIIEIDLSGSVLKVWRLADIISAAMISGGDDPSAFVRVADDWFHNNSATYRKLDDSLLVSSRENFVMALDYETGAIKWILGDPTKAWFQYPSLRKYALTLGGATLPPIGQHALSIAKDGDLLLFDNGRASNAQTPGGEERSYSAPRKYRINNRNMTATETWTYASTPTLFSPYCSSVYEDAWKHYLMDFTLTGDVIGLNSNQEVVFHYKYPTAYFCELSWNAVPIHLENVVYP
jgi:arylsulfate sulfotransferase